MLYYPPPHAAETGCGDGKMKRWEPALRFVGVGFFIGGSIFLGVYVGILLDERFDSQILFTLLGLGLGIVVAAVGVYRMVVSLEKGSRDNGDTTDGERD